MTYAYIDTNVVLRRLLGDDPILTPQADTLVDNAQYASLLITDVVLGEIFYVMRSMDFQRARIAEALRSLLEQPAFFFDQESRLSLLFTLIAETRLDFADCYLVARAIHSGESLETFDKPMLKAYKKYQKKAVTQI